MTIEIKGPDFDGYCLLVNGRTIMECLSDKEVDELTISEIRRIVDMEL